MKTSAFVLVMSTVAVNCTLASQARSWQAVELGQVGPVFVRLKVLTEASLADKEWIGFEFENSSKSPILAEAASYRIALRCYDVCTGHELGPARFVSGNTCDLFPCRCETTPRSPISLDPGVYRVFDQPSLHSSAVLGLPPTNGLHIKAAIRVSFRTKDGVKLKLPTDWVRFEFCWLYPDSDGAGLDRMRRKLKELLECPQRKWGHVYILQALLKIPAVSEDTPIDDLLTALQRRKGRADGRCAIVEHIKTRHVHDATVLDYYRSRLKARDHRVLFDLLEAPELWHDDFIELLMTAFEAQGFEYSVLRALHLHRKSWPDSANIPSRLSDRLVRQYDVLGKTPEELGSEGLGKWAHVARLLGFTGDRSMVPLLRPFLDCKQQVMDPTKLAGAYDLSYARLPPLRVCDFALEAILRILDDDLEVSYRKAGYPTSRGGLPDRETVVTEWTALRDRMITTLKQRLDE